MTREEGLDELNKPLYDDEKMESDIEFILDKISMSRKEFDEIMLKKGVSHSYYRTSKFSNFANLARKFRKYLSD
jgi:hypothetical protein